MKRLLLSVAALAAVVAWAIPTGAAPKGDNPFPPDKPGKKDKGDGFPAAGPSTEARGSFTDDMDKLKEQVGLSETQVTKLTSLRAKRDDLLSKQDQKDKKRIESARSRVEKIKKDAQRKQMTRELEAYTKRLERTRQMMAAQHERIMFGVLTPDQKGKWNAPILQAEVEKELEGVTLTDEQKEQIRKLCDVQAKRTTVPISAAASGTTIKLVANQANLRVLTAEQKREYAKIRAERAREASRRGPQRI